jgi:diguanylate cyclase (GGDEF)-like protein/PAS domain S-box-containing protein
MKFDRKKPSTYQPLDDPELLFNVVYNQQFHSMAILSPVGEVLHINECALASQGQGVTLDDIVGKLFWKSPFWSNLPEWEEHWKKRLAKASKQRTAVISNDTYQINDGSVHFADTSTTAIFNPHTGDIAGYVVLTINTTNQRLIENKILENEARLKFVFDHSNIGNWELNLIDHTSHRSLRHDQIFGHDELLPNWTYEIFLEHVIPEDRAKVDKNFQSAIKNKTDWNFECRIRRKDGKIRWIMASGGHSLEVSGQAKLMAGIVQDVTSLKQAELDRLQYSAELKSIFKALPDIYFRMTPDGKILDYHAPNKNELYVNPQGFLGQHMQDVLPKELGELFQSKIDEATKSETTISFKYQMMINNEITHFDARLNKISLNKQLICVIRNITEQIQLYESLEKAQRQAKVGSWEQAYGKDNSELLWSNETFNIFEYDLEEAISYEHYLTRVHPDDRTKMLSSFESSVKEQTSCSIEYRLLFPDGRIKYLIEHSEHYYSNENQHIRTIGTVQDITKRKSAEEKLQLSSRVFNETHEGITITDSNRLIVDVNPAFCEITGYSREEVIGKNPNILSSGKQDTEFYEDMWKNVNQNGHWQGEVWNRKKNGEIYAELLTISVIKDNLNNTVNYVGVFTDITSSKQQQEQLSRIAHYDLLTNLPNRVLLADRLHQAMIRSRRHKNSLAVVVLDLDGFKAVNDTYGHNMGDELLIAVSLRMQEALREGDSLARFGGDEFVAVLSDLTTVEDCDPILERLLLAASEPITIGDVVLNISVSIGVTIYPQDREDPDLLIRHADQAMYIAKELGKNRYHLFDIAQDDAVKEKQENLESIRNGLANNQFVLHYQPKVNMRSGHVIGFEALIRWQHPKLGLLQPIEFLPFIENSTLSIALGEWVIETALTQISQWQTAGFTFPVNISVNIAAVQLQQTDFTQKLASLLEAHPDVNPNYLELEVLETTALDDVQHVSSIMNSCMNLGVKFALDDFGTGYSSLTYLRRLPTSLIKIDQSFVRDMLHDTDDLSIVEGVIALAKSFKRDVIAEGVESVEHGSALLQLGCELAQGYGIAKPMPAADIPAWIKSWKPDENW